MLSATLVGSGKPGLPHPAISTLLLFYFKDSIKLFEEDNIGQNSSFHSQLYSLKKSKSTILIINSEH